MKKYIAGDIRSLEAGEHIRMRPELYFEKCFSEKSLDSLPFEVLCHAFDEYFDGNCNEIELTIWKNSFSIKYNTGMSLATMKNKNLTTAEIIMTKLGACSNLKKHLAVGQEFCSLGMATINFASEKCKLTTVWRNQKGIFEFENGKLKSKRIESFNSQISWTEITILPNKSLFENLAFTSKGINKKAGEIKKRLNELSLVVIDKIK
jgi:DNA gyrase subunit B